MANSLPTHFQHPARTEATAVCGSKSKKLTTGLVDLTCRRCAESAYTATAIAH